MFYYTELNNSLEKVLKRSEEEGLSDLNCIVIKVSLELDFSHLINYNRKEIKFIYYFHIFQAEFYDYFNTASPEELKGLIRESTIEILQKLVEPWDKEVQLDKRQISIEMFMKNLPCTSE